MFVQMVTAQIGIQIMDIMQSAFIPMALCYMLVLCFILHGMVIGIFASYRFYCV